MRALGNLWRGRMPLAVAFWHYAVFYGLALNVAATVAALILVAAETPIAIPIIVHLLPVPYSILAGFGVWRSADRYAGRPDVATAARIAVVAWFALMLFL